VILGTVDLEVEVAGVRSLMRFQAAELYVAFLDGLEAEPETGQEKKCEQGK
jgi:hypothetical protein